MRSDSANGARELEHSVFSERIDELPCVAELHEDLTHLLQRAQTSGTVARWMVAGKPSVGAAV